MSGIRIVARGAVATVCALAAFGPLVGVAAAQEDSDVPDDTTTSSSVAQEPEPEPEPDPSPPTVPPTTPPTVPPTTPPTSPPTTQTPTTAPPTRPTTPPSNPRPTNPPPSPTTAPRGTTPTTARPAVRAPVIVLPTKREGAVSSSTSAPGAVAAAEPKTAVKTVPSATGDTTTTSEARVAGRSEERGNGNATGDLAAGSFEESSSSLLPSSTLGAILLVAMVGFLAAGAYCAWLLVFARR